MSERLRPLAAGFEGPVTGLFTTRFGGVSTGPWASLNLARHVQDDPACVAANRRRLAALLGAGPLHFAEQVHGDGVAVVEAGSPGEPGWTVAGAPGADALVTASRGVPLVVLAADCLPVLLADRVAGVVAAAHAGRPGLAAGVLQRTLDAMGRLEAEPGRTDVVIGPAICGRCYEVPAGLRDDVAAVVPGSAATTRQGTPALDLREGARQLLAGAGVTSIRVVDICTMEDDSVYSHRGSGGRPTGRHARVVMLDP